MPAKTEDSEFEQSSELESAESSFRSEQPLHTLTDDFSLSPSVHSLLTKLEKEFVPRKHRLATPLLLYGIVEAGISELQGTAIGYIAKLITGRAQNYQERRDRYLSHGGSMGSPDGPPTVARPVYQLFQRAESIAKASAWEEPQIHARHLVGAFLTAPQPFDAYKALEGMGITDLPAIRRSFREYVDRTAPDDYGEAWDSILFGGSLLTAYSADDIHHDELKDRLGFSDDVRGFAAVMSAKSVNPPLSIGLFGDWGSGKSFFMKLLQKRVEKNALDARRRGRTDLFHKIVQIEFNAWHYVEGNLWAGLVAHIFDNLRMPGNETKSIIQQRRDSLIKQLEAVEGSRTEASKQEQAAKDALQEATKQLTQLKTLYEASRDALATASAKDIWHEVKLSPEMVASISKAEKQLGLTGLSDSAKDLDELVNSARTLSGQFKTLWLSLIGGNNRWRLPALAVAMVIGLPLLGKGLQFLLPYLGYSGDTSVPTLITEITAFVTGTITWLKNHARSTQTAMQELETVQKKIRTDFREQKSEQTQDLVKAEKDVELLRAQCTEAQSHAIAAGMKAQAIKAELGELKPSHLLARFIQDRASSDDYRRHLGITALVQKDFSELSDLLQAGIKSEQDDQVDLQIERIILYIDDLDRCPPNKVVQVLEAIHLLLAFPLFVVVVGVDARWVSRSLQECYPFLAPQKQPERPNGVPGATSRDYLEKIFQVPYCLPAMDSNSYIRLAESLSTREEEEVHTPGSNIAPPDPSPSGGAGRKDSSQKDGESSKAPELEINPKTLHIEKHELEYMKKLTQLVGTSPRTLKRFVNVYRILKTTIGEAELKKFAESEYQVVLLLLAVVTGAGALAGTLVGSLRRSSDELELDAFLSKPDKDLHGAQQWQNFHGLAKDLAEETTFKTLRYWGLRAAQFSFDVEKL